MVLCQTCQRGVSTERKTDKGLASKASPLSNQFDLQGISWLSLTPSIQSSLGIMPTQLSTRPISYHDSEKDAVTTGQNYFPDTCKEVYERHWRGQIDRLLKDPDAHPMALLGVVACMELALLCKKGLPLNPNAAEPRLGTTQIITFYFPDERFPGSHLLAEKLTNGLKHNAFIRAGLSLLDTLDGKLIYKPIERKGGELWVAPTAFWTHVKCQIEEIYAQCDCPYDTSQAPKPSQRPE